jgi:hypothetical protein
MVDDPLPWSLQGEAAADSLLISKVVKYHLPLENGLVAIPITRFPREKASKRGGRLFVDFKGKTPCTPLRMKVKA